MSHVAHNSGNVEWYTPAAIVDRARAALGRIDLDPASCDAAQAVVGASEYYTIDDDGLRQQWRGRVWLNPPYARGTVGRWVGKLLHEYSRGRVEAGVVLVNNSTESLWGQGLLANCAAVCLLSGRIRFWAPGVRSVTPLQGQMCALVGPAGLVPAFRLAFASAGVVLAPTSTPGRLL